ncbi:MAG TPA: YbjN domain-containing protein [Miltoncostaeales bacterium]|nr:YbjN domain-containing protein [Miltoncostaeales bacterium]
MIERVAQSLEHLGVPAERVDAGLTVELPSERRGSFTVLITSTERAISLRAFIMRNPDRNHEAVYHRLLAKNFASNDWRFAINAYDDVFLTAYVPHAFAEPDILDGLLGGACAMVDAVFEGIARVGFDIPQDVSLRPPTAPSPESS